MKRAFTLSLLVLFFAVPKAFAILNTPVQTAPADNDTGVATTRLFYIEGISSLADSIEIEYAENISMTSPLRVVRERFNSGAFIYATNLKLNTDYYWRVRVTSSTDSSAWSGIRKFTTTAIFRTIQPSRDVDALNASYVLFRANRVYEYDTVVWQIDTSTAFNSPLVRNVIVADNDSLNEVTTTQENFRYGLTYHWRARAYSATDISDWTPTLYFTIGDSIILKYPSANWPQEVEEEVDWTNWQDGDAVQLQLDTTPNFTSPVRDTFLAEGVRQGLGPRYKLEELDYETQYYYRARAYNAVDSTVWSVGSFNTKGLATDVVIAPNYADPSFVYYNRTRIDGSDGYHLLLDTTESFNSPELKSTYSPTGRDTAEDLLFGVNYYTKARPYHSRDTGEWTRSRLIRMLQFPIIYYPYQNSTDIGIKDSVQFGTREGIDGYQIQITAGTTYDTTLLLDTILAATGFYTTQNFIKGLTFRYNTTYHWHIRGWHSKDTSPWSTSQKFTTVASPTLTRPFDSDFLGDQAALDLQWESLGNGTRYQVMLDTSLAFDSPILVDTVVDTNALSQKDLYFRPLYYWKVRAVSTNDTSAWSETWKFTVLHARLNRPSNNNTNVSLNINSLDWASIDGTDGYIVELDSFADFRNPAVFTDTVKNSFFHYFFETPDILTFQTKYYWRVKLYHSLDTTEWSAVWNFTTLPRRSPVLESPADSAEDVPVFATLKWKEYTIANSYAVEYATLPDFSNATKTSTSSTSVDVALQPNTRYYWRVRGRNSSGQEFYDWSEEWTFTTDEGIPAPILLSPANNAENVSPTEPLRWNKNDNAISYRVELSSDSTFQGSFSKNVSVASTSFSEVRADRTYFWRVRTTASGITSPWSETWKFSTAKTGSITTPGADYIIVYPNPSADFLTLTGFSGKTVVIELIGTRGEVIRTIQSSNTDLTLDIRELANGAYHLLITDDGLRSTKTFVVNR